MTAFLVLLIGALTGWALNVLATRYLIRRVPGYLHQLSQGDPLNLGESVAPLADEAILSMMNQVKARVPMASLMIDGPMGDEVKQLAREEVMKTIPQLPARAMEGMTDADIESVVRRRFARELLYFQLFGALSGLLVAILCLLLLGAA